MIVSELAVAAPIPCGKRTDDNRVHKDIRSGNKRNIVS
jgi:hypothetical protein